MKNQVMKVAQKNLRLVCTVDECYKYFLFQFIWPQQKQIFVQKKLSNLNFFSFFRKVLLLNRF